MTRSITCAIFPTHDQADEAVLRLRRSGVPDEAIAMIGKDGSAEAEAERPDNKASGALKGLGIGAGTGTLFGLTALMIPGVGPFIAAGSLIESLGIIGSAAASGAIVGGTAGGLTGALMHYGLSEEDARYYEGRIRDGGIWLAVDARRAPQSPDTIAGMLHAAGGTTTSRSPMHDHA